MFDRQRVNAMPPGPELARVLTSVDPDSLDRTETLVLLRAWQRQQAYWEGRRADMLAHLARLRDRSDP